MANLESQVLAQSDTDAKANIALSKATSQALETNYNTRIADLWTLLYAGLLATWIQPTPSVLPPQEISPTKTRIANKLYGAYKKFKFKAWLAGKDINSSLNAKPNRTHKGHTSCYALLLVWVKDNIGGAITEAEALKKQLEEKWGFWGDIYRIPFMEESTAQQEVVERAVDMFIEHRDGDSNFLLVHYGGHGGLNSGNEYVLQGFNRRLHEVRFKPIRERLQECKADVGMFLDACYSEAGIYRSVQPHTVEVLSACSEENTTPPVSPESFTNGVIRVLSYYQEETLHIHELSEELTKLTYPKLGNEPVLHALKLSMWGSTQFRRGPGGKTKYSNVRPLFVME